MASTFDFIARLIARDETKAAYAAATASVNQLSTAQQRAAKSAGTGAPTAAQIRRQQEYTAAIKERAIAEKQLASAVEAGASKTRASGGGASGLEKFVGAAGKILGISVGAYAVRQAADWAIATTEIGASALDVEKSLARLSDSYGVNGQEITRQLVAMSHGSMTTMDAMANVNRALFAQNTELARKLPQLFSIARSAAIKSGEDVTRVYDSLILGVLRGSYRLIDNADIYLRVAEIVERWAAGMGTTVDAMSIQERQTAVLNAILQDGAAVADAATSSMASYAESVKAVSSSYANLKQEVGKGFAEWGVDSGFLQSLIDTLDRKTAEYARMREDNEIEKWTLTDPVGKFRFMNEMSKSGFSKTDAEIIDTIRDEYREYVKVNEILSRMGAQMRAHQGSTKDVANATDDAASSAKDYEERVKELNALIPNLSGILAANKRRLEEQNIALRALNSAGISAAAGYRALGDAILDTMGQFGVEEMGNLTAQTLRGVESQLIGMVGTVPIDQLKDKWAELGPEIISTLSNFEGSTFDAKLAAEGLRVSVTGWGKAFEDAGKESEKALNGVKKTLEDLYGEIESVATSGLEVTPQDVLDTQAGTYQNKALEPVRRLRDIVEKGLESPYAGLFKIPPEVLEQGADAIKAWANRLADRGAALLDINLVDKDAFLRQWDEFQADVEAKKNTLATMAGWLVSSGRVSSLGEGKATAAKMLGIEDPEGAAKSVGTGLIAGITSADITGSVINHMVTEGKKREKEYKDAGGEIGKLWASGFLDTVKTDVGKVRSILAELLVPEIIARLPQGAPP